MRRPSNAPCTRLVRYGRAPPACAIPPARAQWQVSHAESFAGGVSVRPAPAGAPGPRRARRRDPHPRQSRGTITTPRTGEFRTMPSRAPRWRAATGNGAATPAVPSGSHQKPARARSRALTKQVDFAILPRICNHRSPYGLQGLVKNGSHFSVLQSWRFFVHFPAMTDFFCAFSFPFGKKRRREDPSGASIFFFFLRSSTTSNKFSVSLPGVYNRTESAPCNSRICLCRHPRIRTTPS